MNIILSILMLLVASPAWSADEWLKTRPASTDQWTAFPAANQANNAAIDRMLANYREGMTLTYSSATTISVTAGEVMCSNSDGSVRKMRQNTSAVNVTFADIDTGAEASSTTYYLYAVADADATTATFKISASSTAPTGVTYYKRLGSFYNDASSNISQIINDNSEGISYGLDYGTSTSSYVIKSSGLKVAYGQATWTSGATVTITGLPFSSSSSYKVVVSPVSSAVTNTWPPNVYQTDGASFTIGSTTTGTVTGNWIAIGI